MSLNRLVLTLISAVMLSACGENIKLPDTTANAGIPRNVYIVVQRNQRLPPNFIETLKRQSQLRLPEAQINVNDNSVDDQTLAGADWVIALRATLIKPNYFYKPSDNSTLNGLNDCLAGSTFGAGIFLSPLSPCIYSTDAEFLEANVRNAAGKTLQTYVARPDSEGWWRGLPFTALGELFRFESAEEKWAKLVDQLYDKMLADDIFNPKNALAEEL